jgi:hypothetical protein
MCPSFSDGNSGDDIYSCPWEMEEEQNKKEPVKWESRKEIPLPQVPLWVLAHWCPPVLGRYLIFLITMDYFRKHERT